MAKQLQSTKSAPPAAGDGKIVSPVEQARSNLAKIEAIHTAAAAACAAAGERADQDAYRAAIGELSADEADAAAEEHKRALRDLERGKRALGTAKAHLDEAEDAARRQARKDRRDLLERLLAKRAERHAGLAGAIGAYDAALQSAHEADVAVDRFFGGAAPAGSGLSAKALLGAVSRELARLGPGDPLGGGQKESGRLASPASATRAERASADVSSIPAALVAAMEQTNAYMMRTFDAGVEKVNEPVNAVTAGDIDKLPRPFRDNAEQQLGRRDADQPLSVADIIALGYDPSSMTRGTRTVADLMAEHEQRHPKVDMGRLAAPKLSVETPRPPVERSPMVGNDEATLARVRAAEDRARQTKDRVSLRQLRDSFTGTPGSLIDAIPLDRADAFLAELATLPAAGKPAAGKPAEPDMAPAEQWIADDDVR
jgi:hypothetical protein